MDGGFVRGGPRLVLRLEGAAVLAACAAGYAAVDGGWWLFAVLFLAPDLAFLGYLAGARVGAVAYNATHSLLGPLALGAAGATMWPALLPLALIWGAHVGFDRMLGYGLKYGSAFGHTHLGPIGRAARPGFRRDERVQRASKA